MTPNNQLFRATYTEALAECVRTKPELYAWPIENVPTVAGRMFAAMDGGTFNHDSAAYKLTAKRLGIKPTRTAILAYWKS